MLYNSKLDLVKKCFVLHYSFVSHPVKGFLFFLILFVSTFQPLFRELIINNIESDWTTQQAKEKKSLEKNSFADCLIKDRKDTQDDRKPNIGVTEREGSGGVVKAI